jgi:hypothetical protein
VIVLPRAFYFVALFLFGLFIAAVGYIGYLLINSSNETRLAVLTAAVSVATLVYAQTQNAKREVAGRLFEKKAEAYEQIMVVVSEAVRRGNLNSLADDQLLKSILPKLLIWGGRDVLWVWSRALAPRQDPIDSAKAVNELLTAVRQELGHTPDRNLDLLGIIK